MANYIGIDLGTTNSAICFYDGENLRIYKSPEQHSVTPSAIYIDKRSRHYGARAYQMAANAPNNTANLFKRFMGTNTPINISAVGITMTPEECSAEILRFLFSYLPEEIRNDKNTGTVITVPAAFNQMQKDSTLEAANMAGIGQVVVMQEPVAAIMSVMRHRKTDGTFLIYDMGGGTFDIALAESISGRVSLLSHGGVEMCGGRDFDRAIVDSIIKPWLLNKFDLPNDFTKLPKYSKLIRIANLAAEEAKIELSFNKEETIIYKPDADIRICDESGEEIYLEVPLTRTMMDQLLAPKIQESIEATRELLEKSQTLPQDIERMIFIGGPTQYEPLRKKVAFELGISGSTEVDPMTAVAEGAALFAESIDWQSEQRGHKSGRGTISMSGSLKVDFHYQARTPDGYSMLVVKVNDQVKENATWQIDSLDSGWSSGRMELMDGKSIRLTLEKNGKNCFKVFVYDAQGGAVKLENDLISIVRATATIDGIPASHSIGVAVKDKAGGKEVLDYLVKKGDPLPCKNKRIWRAEESLRANDPGQISILLWEGEIEDPLNDNRCIGAFKITGKDFDEGVIEPNAEIICDYEISESGIIKMMVTVPSISGTFASDHNYYSRQGVGIDYANYSRQIEEEIDGILNRIDTVFGKIDDSRLHESRKLLEESRRQVHGSCDPEICKQAIDYTLAVKKTLSNVFKDNRKPMRLAIIEGLQVFFEHIREIAKPAECNSYENLFKSAKRAIEKDSSDLERFAEELRDLNWMILWRQDWFVIERFNYCKNEEYNYIDKVMYRQLIEMGSVAIKVEDISKLREIVMQLCQNRIHNESNAIFDPVNIVRG